MTATPGPPVDVEGDAEGLDDALADPAGTVAVVADPFFDHETVLDHAASTLDATRVRLGPGTESVPTFDDGPVVADGCHHLYARRVGGFDPIDRFLDRLASASCRVVTSWNRYSWNYLHAVRDLGDAFRHVLTLPSLWAERIGATIRARDDALPTFEDPSGGNVSPVTTVTYEEQPRRRPVAGRRVGGRQQDETGVVDPQGRAVRGPVQPFQSDDPFVEPDDPIQVGHAERHPSDPRPRVGHRRITARDHLRLVR
jgi:hypothetical protein